LKRIIRLCTFLIEHAFSVKDFHTQSLHNRVDGYAAPWGRHTIAADQRTTWRARWRTEGSVSRFLADIRFERFGNPGLGLTRETTLSGRRS
jgi:hypothetical protein